MYAHLLIACALLCSAEAGAQTVAPAAPPAVVPQSPSFDDRDGEPLVVTNRARPLNTKIELTLLFTPTLIEKYLNHLGGLAGVTFHISNVVSIEGLGGYEYMREASIVGGDSGVRSLLSGTREPHLPDLLGMSWIALAGLGLAPIYGKLNLFSEVDFNSQVYFIVGGGAVGVVRRQLAAPGDATQATVTVPYNYGARIAVDVGVGLRLFLTRWLALRAEFRDIAYWDSFDYTGNGTPTLDIIHNFMGVFGASFIVN